MQGRLDTWAFRRIGFGLVGAWAAGAAVLATASPADAGCRMVGIWNKFQVCDTQSESGPRPTPLPPPIPPRKDPAVLHYEAATALRRAGDAGQAVERLEQAYQALDKSRNRDLHRKILADLSALYVELANRAIARRDYAVLRRYLRNARDWAWYLDQNFQDRSWLAEANRLQAWLDDYERRQAKERERLSAIATAQELIDAGRLAEAVHHLQAAGSRYPEDREIRGLLLQANLSLDARRSAALAAGRAQKAARDDETRERVRRDLADLMDALAEPSRATQGSALADLMGAAPTSAFGPAWNAAPPAPAADASVVDLRDLGSPGAATPDPYQLKEIAAPDAVPVPVAGLRDALAPTVEEQAHRRNAAVLDAIQAGQRQRGATELDWAATLAYLREARQRYPDDLAVRDAAVMLLAIAPLDADAPMDQRGLLPPVTAADLPDYETWSLLVRAEHHRLAGTARYLGDRNGWSMVRRELETARELYQQAHARNPRSLALRDQVNHTDGLIIFFIGLERTP